MLFGETIASFILRIIRDIKAASLGAFAKRIATLSLAMSFLPSARLESNFHQTNFRKVSFFF
jgi:hypothetical protein